MTFSSLGPRLSLPLAVAALLTVPASVHAQNPMQLLRSISQGGGWLSVPITEGRGEISTDTVPTFGLSVKGCLTVWPGHSGRWTLKAEDPLNDQQLDAEAAPGEGVPFSYESGPRSALEVLITWSEARDTTLNVWVGVETRNAERDACDPVYPERGGRQPRPERTH